MIGPLPLLLATVLAAAAAPTETPKPPQGPAATLAAAAAPTETPKPPGKPPEKPADERWEKYAVVAERNMFSRERGQRKPAPADSSQTPTVSRRDLVLTGIARKGAELTAFVEDAVSHETRKLRVGDEIGGGKVTAIQLDHVVFERNGNTAKVELGADLGRGGAAAAALGPAVAAPGAASSPPASGAESDILKRLRERRARELGKK